jgi:peptidyl-tRNA hydrolase
MMAFQMRHHLIATRWYHASSNLVVLQVPDEEALKDLAGRVEAADLYHAVFREPDLDNTVTAVALEPAGWRMVSDLPLALRMASKAQEAA